jgi:hypothetical protein
MGQIGLPCDEASPQRGDNNNSDFHESHFGLPYNYSQLGFAVFSQELGLQPRSQLIEAGLSSWMQIIARKTLENPTDSTENLN